MEGKQLEMDFDGKTIEPKNNINNPEEKSLEEEKNKIGVELNIWGDAREKLYKKDGVWMVGNQTAAQYSTQIENLYNDTDEEYYKGQK